MIVLLDGTFGVGKSTVANRIVEKLSDKNVQHFDSDFYWREFVEELFAKATKFYFPKMEGLDPQNNKEFIDRFRRLLIEEALKDTNKIIIVTMALTQKKCKEGVLDYLLQQGIQVLHIILLADIETIQSHVAHDSDERKKKALEDFSNNISFFNNNFEKALRFQVNNKPVDEIADDIIDTVIKKKLEGDVYGE